MAWARKRYAVEKPPRGHSSPASNTVLLQGRYRYSTDKVLGEGSYGTVYQGLDLVECRGIAVKVYRESESIALQNFKKSVDVLLTIRRRAAMPPKDPTSFDGTMEMSLYNETTMSFKPSTFSEDMACLGEIFREITQALLSHMDFTGCFVAILGYSRDHLGAPGRDVDSDSLYIVYELGQESLQSRLVRCATDGVSLTPEELRKLQWDLVTIVCGLHSQGFVHLDIKPANIVRFCTDGGEAQWKLIDLDGAMKTGNTVPLELVCFTMHYMSPELASAYLRSKPSKVGVGLRQQGSDGVQLSRLIDVWSVGMCALEPIFLTPVLGPWYSEWRQQTGSDVKFLSWLADSDAEPIVSGEMRDALAEIDADMCDMLQGMLAKDVLDRLSITECLTHRWFAPIRAKLLEDVKKLVEPSRGSLDDELRSVMDDDFPCSPTGRPPNLMESPVKSVSKSEGETSESVASFRKASARVCRVM
eukprot:TRINITY_DN18829_c0_g1_i1.p1 TRINITY_DN18829_c0_g1~~TRINITY_DN18829_c0_g1_i1.p1  ORF type:complete len:473 (+),score=40.38 TRINITY_DN18829_c0_g1_i1:114-1532(+)